MHSGKFKYLRRKGTEDLYDVAADPRERADLKEDARETFEELKRAHADWNAAMLEYPADSISAGSEVGPEP